MAASSLDSKRTGSVQDTGTRSRSDGRELSVLSYFGAFAPAPEWSDLVSWPPDVFALTNLILDHTESYRLVVAPPAGRRWPPLEDWDARVRAAGRAWKDSGTGGPRELPQLVRDCWSTVTRFRDIPLARIRSGDAWELNEALLTLHSIADEACAGVTASGRRGREESFERLAWRRLSSTGSLSRLSPTRVRIVPKTLFSPRGITIRSLSRYLALCYESVDVRWKSVTRPPAADRRDVKIVLVPWPLTVTARDFRPASAIPIENMDFDHFGFFEFAPKHALDCDALSSILDTAIDDAGRVDAVVFPESAVRADEVSALEHVLARHGVMFLVAGVRQPSDTSAFGRNYLHFGVHTATGWERLEQDKHHRWCLDPAQIRQYHLTRSLDPRKFWWEAVDVRERELHIIDVGGGVLAAPLVCEDLARLDEVADLIRRIGPSLVIAVLLDGPQLSSRWPSRYASILADEPGSAVLTLTAFGMAIRSRPAGMPASRVVAHWTSGTHDHHEIALAPGAVAVLVSAAVEGQTLWTADGRRHDDVPRLVLSETRSLKAGARRRSRSDGPLRNERGRPGSTAAQRRPG